MERMIKAGSKKYEAFAGNVVYMGDYKAPEDELKAGYEAYHFKGFDMLPIKNFVVQTGKALEENPALDGEAGVLTVYNNVLNYGHECGALAMPTIIMYNNVEKCYYGLELWYEEKDYKKYGITRYDENGRYLSRRFITINNDGTVDKEFTTCNKKLYNFVFEMIRQCKERDYKLEVKQYEELKSSTMYRAA
mgnify:CR=1 FL=1